jgi:hypothetical protein
VHERDARASMGYKDIYMGSIALKSSLHAILDRIENEQWLCSVHDFLVEHEQAKEGQIWKTLTEEQKREVLASYAAPEEEQNFVSWKELKAKYGWVSCLLKHFTLLPHSQQPKIMQQKALLLFDFKPKCFEIAVEIGLDKIQIVLAFVDVDEPGGKVGNELVFR